MKQTSFRELQSILTQLESKTIEVNVKTALPFSSTNTYQNFSWRIEPESLVFEDGNAWSTENIQRHSIRIKDIKDISLLDTSDIYSEVIFLLLDDVEIGLCIAKTIRCCNKNCKKIIDTPIETAWTVGGIGNYGSFADGHNLSLNLCDDCLEEMLGGEFGG